MKHKAIRLAVTAILFSLPVGVGAQQTCGELETRIGDHEASGQLLNIEVSHYQNVLSEIDEYIAVVPMSDEEMIETRLLRENVNGTMTTFRDFRDLEWQRADALWDTWTNQGCGNP